MGVELTTTTTASGEWTPDMNGYIGWSIDPMGCASSGLTSGTLYVVRVPLQNPATITTISMACLTAGSGFTSAVFGLYDPSDFSLLATSGSLTTAFGSAGLIDGTFTGVTVTSSYVYTAALIVASGMPAVARASTSGGANSSLVNAGLDSSNYRAFFGGTSLSSLPDPISTFTSVSLTPWMAVS